MTQALAVELAASASVSSDGQGSSVDAGSLRRALVLQVLVTDFVEVDSDPAPAVVVSVQTRPTDSAPWREAGSVTVTATGAYKLSVGGLDRYVRAAWTLTNMTSVEFSVAGEAHVVYADPTDITAFAVPEASIEEIGASQRVDALVAATEVADGFLNSSFELPISAWGSDLRQNVAILAAATLFRQRGADPQGPDVIVFDSESRAMKWFDRISNGRLKPPGIVDTTPDAFEGGGFVVMSKPKRGW